MEASQRDPVADELRVVPTRLSHRASRASFLDSLALYVSNMHNRSTDIEFDPAKAGENLRKHGVSFADAEQALRDPNSVTVEDPDAQGEQRFITLGMDALGRILVIIHTQRADRTRIVSARKASKSEAAEYAKGI